MIIRRNIYTTYQHTKLFEKSVPVDLKELNKWKNVQTDAGKYFAESVS